MTPEAITRLGPAFWRRLAALLTLLALIFAFRHLALLGVSFLIFASGFGWLSARLAKVLGGSRRRGVLAVFVSLLLLLGLGVLLSLHAGTNFYTKLIHEGPLTTRMDALQDDILKRVPAWIPVDDLKERVPHLLSPALGYAQTTGRVLLHVLIGLILSAVYLLDPDDICKMIAAPPEESFLGSLRRYATYLSEAILITIQLQVLVALVNTVLTVPVLLLLGLPHLLAFTVMIFICSLIPVVGNLLSGAVLIVASYIYTGIWGVIGFVVITFILHKIEAYYLNPRLTARHVHLPALVLIVSLIGFEHAFGIIGLFLSFPSLYIGIKVWQDFQSALAPKTEEDAQAPAAP